MALFEALLKDKPSAAVGGKVIEAEEAVRLIKDGDTVNASGIAGTLVPEKVLTALENRFLTTGEPRNLTLFFSLMFGSMSPNGMERFAHQGLLRRVIGANYYHQRYPRLSGMITDNQIEAYCFPLGSLLHLMRETALGRPGLLTKVALGTFIDPREQGGRLNASTKKDLVELVQFRGEEYLFYPAIPVDVAIIRGTTADEDGNLSLEHEPISLAMLLTAMVTKNSGGKVIAQVKRLAARGSVPPRLVEVPGFLVDAIVVDEDQKQSETADYDDPGVTGALRVPVNPVVHLPLDCDKVIARRAARAIRPGWLVNLGGGIPISNLAFVLREETVDDLITISIEHGALGGVNEGSHLHRNPTAFLESDRLMDYYVGGGLDATFLGLGEVDREGNINLSKFGNTYPGPGGAIDISHKTPKVFFCGSFRRNGLQVKAGDGRLSIVQEGTTAKFVERVQQITIHGQNRLRNGQEVYYITERAVFQLEERGLMLTEIAPGIDLRRDVLDQAEFEIIVSANLKEMDRRIFADAPMGLRQQLVDL